MTLLRTLNYMLSHPLNREHKFKTLVRFVSWQLGSRLVPGTVVFDWVNGARFLVKNGDTGLTGNIYSGLDEFQDMAFVLHFLREEDLFVDVGANVGSYTILACKAVGARGFAFEPVPSSYKRLVENMRLNDVGEKVKCINKGVGAKLGSLAFTSGSDTTNHALASGEQCDNKVTVEMTSLDSVLRDESPALMKIDVEGYETLVLEGAQETLKKPALRCVIMELNGSGARYGYDEARIIDAMFAHGFKTCSYSPLDRTLVDTDGKDMRSPNVLFIRDESFVRERLKNAPKVTIGGTQL